MHGEHVLARFKLGLLEFSLRLFYFCELVIATLPVDQGLIVVLLLLEKSLDSETIWTDFHI